MVNCIKFLICSQRENKSGRGTGKKKVTRPKWLKSLYSIFHFKHRKGESFSIKGYCCCSLAKSCPTICDSWTATCQASQSFTISWSLLKLTSIESVMPSNYLILCHSLLLLPSIFPSIRVFSSESVLRLRWPKYWSFSISPSNEYSELVSIRIDWFDLLAVKRTLKSPLQHHSSKASILRCSAFFMVQLSQFIHDYWKSHSFDQTDICWQNNVSAV